MTLGELRQMIGEANYDKVPQYNKIYINVDYHEMSVGLHKSFTGGMRAVSNDWRSQHNIFLTFAELLKGENINTLSDGKYDVPIAKGVAMPLDEDLSDWEIFLSDRLKSQLIKDKLIKADAFVEENDKY